MSLSAQRSPKWLSLHVREPAPRPEGRFRPFEFPSSGGAILLDTSQIRPTREGTSGPKSRQRSIEVAPDQAQSREKAEKWMRNRNQLAAGHADSNAREVPGLRLRGSHGRGFGS